MTDREIAHHALKFIGGTPSVTTYHSEDRKQCVDVLRCDNSFRTNEVVYSTLGLNHFDFGLTVEKKELRVEVMAITIRKNDCAPNALATIAFKLRDAGKCAYGTVVKNVFSDYLHDGIIKHAVLLSPIFWKDYASVKDKHRIVSWLLAVPLSDKELALLERYGVDALEHHLELSQIEVADLNRSDSL